jgi:hypothetical protein
MERGIKQNPQRYKSTEESWVVSSVGDSPNGNPKGEIKPITLQRGKVVDLSTIKPVLAVDGMMVKMEEILMVSQNTLEEILKWDNPHYSFLENGSVVIKGKSVSVGKTIPIIEISSLGFQSKGEERDIANRNAGVRDVDYIYEGDTEMGVPINLIQQINYTLNENISRPGDTFSIWEYQLGNSSTYSFNELSITTTQEDGKFDKAKLTSFISEVDKRLQILNEDFSMIKRVFYSGDTPTNKGVIQYTDEVADTNSDTTFAGDSYLEESSKVMSVSDTPKDKSIDATTKVIEEKTTNVQKQVEEQKRELASTQQKQTLAQQQLQEDLKQQAQRTDEYYKQKYGSGTK